MEKIENENFSPFLEKIELKLSPQNPLYENEFITASWCKDFYEIEIFLEYINSYLKTNWKNKYNWNIRNKCKGIVEIRNKENNEKFEGYKFNKFNQLIKWIISQIQKSKNEKSNLIISIIFDEYEQILGNNVGFHIVVLAWKIIKKKKINNIWFIYDTNFLLKLWGKNPYYDCIKDIFDTIQSNSIFFNEVSTCLLEREKNWNFSKKEQDKMLCSFKKELSKINPLLSKNILWFFNFSYNVFLFIYNLLEDIKKQNPQKNFNDIQEEFFEIINKKIDIGYDFLNKNRRFFLKMFNLIEIWKSSKKISALTDWMNFSFSISINIFSPNESRSVFVSDDNDFQTIAEFFINIVIPWYLCYLLSNKFIVSLKNSINTWNGIINELKEIPQITIENNIPKSDLIIRIEKLLKDYLNKPEFKYKIKDEIKKQIICLFTPSSNTITNLYLPDTMINTIRWSKEHLSLLEIYTKTILKLLLTLESKKNVA